MFERFTERARRVVVLAQEEAMLLNHAYIGTEHVLLGLIRDGEGVAAKALDSLGISLESVRREVEQAVGVGQSSSGGHIPFTPRAKKVLELSLREAIRLGHNYIGTEHILLGLIQEGEGVAAQVLQKLGAGLDVVRRAVMQLLEGHRGGTQASAAAPPREMAAEAPRCPKCGASLTEAAAYRVLEVPPHEGQGEPRRVGFVFCRRCGTSPGTIP